MTKSQGGWRVFEHSCGSLEGEAPAEPKPLEGEAPAEPLKNIGKGFFGADKIFSSDPNAKPTPTGEFALTVRFTPREPGVCAVHIQSVQASKRER